MKFRLKQTCCVCPEQYDVFLGDRQVAYMRLRHGYFYCAYPDIGGEVIYSAYPKGDGCFDDDERDYYIRAALKELKKVIEDGIDYTIEAED